MGKKPKVCERGNSGLFPSHEIDLWMCSKPDSPRTMSAFQIKSSSAQEKPQPQTFVLPTFCP
jgi:hypothetical protein